MASLEEVKRFIKDSIDWLKEEDMGCTTLKLDDRLAICVGWLKGYGDEKRDDAIQSEQEPDFAINAGIKVWTSDDMRTDYEYINMPYYDGGEVVETDITLDPADEKDGYEQVAKWLLDQYEDLKDLNIDEDGLIHETKPEETTEVEKEVEEESLKEEKETCKVYLDRLNNLKTKEDAEKYFKDSKDWPEGVAHARDTGALSNAEYNKLFNKMLKICDKFDIKESLKEKKTKKDKLKESWAGEGVIDDIADRAKSMIEEGKDVDEAIFDSIDNGLIYNKDIYALLEHYGSIDAGTIIESFLDDLYGDVYARVADYAPKSEEEF